MPNSLIFAGKLMRVPCASTGDVWQTTHIWLAVFVKSFA
jgi:hypothetical protein